MAPDNWLPERLSSSRLVKSPSSEGMVPDNCSPGRSSPTTRPLLVLVPLNGLFQPTSALAGLLMKWFLTATSTVQSATRPGLSEGSST